MPYRVRYENVQDATAPAQRVTVTDTLDPNLDLSTFELTEIAFANQFITVPVGLSHYHTQLAFTVTNQTLIPLGDASVFSLGPLPTNSILVDVDASLDASTRQLTLSLSTTDPATGWWPEDPLIGFLYPNNTNHVGEGSLSYLVRPRAGLPSGTRIENRARIVFDVNDPIDTPLVFNTIDAGAPSSAVQALPATSDRTFLVQWSGQDDPGGSGIASYDIFVSDDGTNYFTWLSRTTDTSALFTGVPGATYWFYSVARDNVGHEEAAPATADASTTINTPFTLGLTVESLPATALVGSNFTYTVVVANQGPGHATNVVLTHSLDPAFAVVAAVPSQGMVEQTGGLVTARFGALGASAAARLNMELTPQMAGTYTNRLEVTSDQGVIAAADVVVPVSAVPPRLVLSLGADMLTFTWPVSATGFVLESAGSLSPPIQWAPVTNEPVVVGGLETLHLQPTNGTAFYRLRWVP
jgi:uncharacterized repeat protein (TIGR01451 family)